MKTLSVCDCLYRAAADVVTALVKMRLAFGAAAVLNGGCFLIRDGGETELERQLAAYKPFFLGEQLGYVHGGAVWVPNDPGGFLEKLPSESRCIEAAGGESGRLLIVVTDSYTVRVGRKCGEAVELALSDDRSPGLVRLTSNEYPEEAPCLDIADRVLCFSRATTHTDQPLRASWGEYQLFCIKLGNSEETQLSHFVNAHVVSISAMPSGGFRAITMDDHGMHGYQVDVEGNSPQLREIHSLELVSRTGEHLVSFKGQYPAWSDRATGLETQLPCLFQMTWHITLSRSGSRLLVHGLSEIDDPYGDLQWWIVDRESSTCKRVDADLARR